MSIGKFVKGFFKAVVWTFAILFAVLLVAIATCPLWLGPAAKSVANRVVPAKTGSEFHVEEIRLNPFTGKFFVRDCRLKNPDGYKNEQAFGVSTVAVHVAMNTLFTKCIEVKSIEVRGLRASYEGDDRGVNNFERIAANATGTVPKAEMTKEERKAAKREAAERDAAEAAERDAAAARGEEPTQVVIDRFELSDSRIDLSLVRGMPALPLALPSVSLSDIGKDNGGASLADVWNAICAGCMQAGGAAGDGLKSLGGLLGDGASAAGDAAGKAADAVGDTAGKAVDAVGDAAGKAVDALGGLFRKSK